MKRLFMESTEISAEKTAGEIASLLVGTGARQISMQYDERSRITGLAFAIGWGKEQMYFSLPVRTEPIFRAINGRRPKETYQRGNREEWTERDRVQAERVAWRQLLRWTEAQLALIETGMVKAGEVFMPYMLDGKGQTMWEQFEQTKLLEAPKEEAKGAG